MSTNTTTADTLENLREAAFVVVLLIGALLFSLGGAFLVIGVTINTAPPAPYVSPTDRWLLVVGSIAGVVVGAVLIRMAARIVGW